MRSRGALPLRQRLRESGAFPPRGLRNAVALASPCRSFAFVPSGSWAVIRRRILSMARALGSIEAACSPRRSSTPSGAAIDRARNGSIAWRVTSSVAGSTCTRPYAPAYRQETPRPFDEAVHASARSGNNPNLRNQAWMMTRRLTSRSRSAATLRHRTDGGRPLHLGRFELSVEGRAPLPDAGADPLQRNGRCSGYSLLNSAGRRIPATSLMSLGPRCDRRPRSPTMVPLPFRRGSTRDGLVSPWRLLAVDNSRRQGLDP